MRSATAILTTSGTAAGCPWSRRSSPTLGAAGPAPPATRTARGYVRVYRPEHPNAVGLGWVYEHVLVMSQLLGRPLFPDEQVHHRNGQRDDNRAGNLELWTTLRQPTGQRVEDLVRWALTILERYEPWRLR